MSIPIRIPGEDFELNLPEEHLSFSKIDLFRQCGERYRRVVIEGQKEPYGQALFEGECLDDVLTHWLKEPSGKRKLGPMLQSYNARFCHLSKNVAEWTDEPDEVNKRGRAFIEKSHKSGMIQDFKPIRIKGKLGLQLEVTEPIMGVPMLGYVDLVEKKLITDFKVAKNSRWYKPETSLQLGYYAVALKIPDVAYEVFCKETMKIEFLHAKLNLDKVRKKLAVIVTQVAEMISKRMFPVCDPKTNFLCSSKWCPFWGTCMGELS